MVAPTLRLAGALPGNRQGTNMPRRLRRRSSSPLMDTRETQKAQKNAPATGVPAALIFVAMKKALPNEQKNPYVFPGSLSSVLVVMGLHP